MYSCFQFIAMQCDTYGSLALLCYCLLLMILHCLFKHWTLFIWPLPFANYLEVRNEIEAELSLKERGQATSVKTGVCCTEWDMCIFKALHWQKVSTVRSIFNDWKSYSEKEGFESYYLTSDAARLHVDSMNHAAKLESATVALSRQGLNRSDRGALIRSRLLTVDQSKRCTI